MTDTTADRPTYGNWFAQKSPGLFGAGLFATVLLFVGVIFSLGGLLFGGWRVGLVLLIAFGLGYVATGTPVGASVHRGVLYRRAKSAQDTEFRSGPLSKKRNPENRLPGLLGKTKLLHQRDTFGQPFAVIKSPGNMWTIVARCSADGPWLQDQDRINSWVANYSVMLSAFAQEQGLLCVKVITDTAPDPGGRLGSMVRSMREASAPLLARMVIDECVAELPATSSENHTYIELTYRGRQLSRKNDERAITAELARRIPRLVQLASAAGGGSVEMVSADELARVVRVAFDPAIQASMEAADIDGDPDVFDWTDAGPAAYSERWADLYHDSGHSITFEMREAPRSKVIELALAGFVGPHRDFARKRVALIYRPHTPDEASRVAEQDARTANFQVGQSGKKRASASAEMIQRAAEQSRQEVAAGAGSVRFSIMFTVTTLFGGDMDQAVSTIHSAAGAVPIRVRRCYGGQAAGFVTTLPVGFLPWEHTLITPRVREWL